MSETYRVDALAKANAELKSAIKLVQMFSTPAVNNNTAISLIKQAITVAAGAQQSTTPG